MVCLCNQVPCVCPVIPEYPLRCFHFSSGFEIQDCNHCRTKFNKWPMGKCFEIIIPMLHRRGVYCFTSLRPSVCPKIFFIAFFSATIDGRNLIFGHKLHIRYPISWEVFLDPSHSYFLFADLVGFYTHWTYMQRYHKWTLAHSSSCFSVKQLYHLIKIYVFCWLTFHK